MSRYRSYWAGTGLHQAEFKRLRAALVPVGGAAETEHGELLRAVARLYHHAKTNGLRHVEAHWAEWRTVDAHRAALAAAIGPQGTWVLAVVERAVTERYMHARFGVGTAPAKFPHDAFEKLVDACVVTVRAVLSGAS